MTSLNTDDAPATDGDLAPFEDDADSVNTLAVASVALSGMGFLTPLRLADRTDRTPARALGLFLMTWLETISGPALGLVAANRASEAQQPSKGFFLGASRAVLGVITTFLNLNWMRTRRRL